MKVAQYAVLGIMQKQTSVPQGTIEVFWLLILPYAASQQGKEPSIVPFLLRHPDYGGQAGTARFF
jgi:hypothetical protein